MPGISLTDSQPDFSPTAGTPRPSKDGEFEILTGQLLTAAPIATRVVDVKRAREVTITVEVNAASADNRVHVIPVYSRRKNLSTTPPVPGDDVWSVPCEPGQAAAGASPIASVPAGVDFTVADSFHIVDMQPVLIRMPLAAAATAEHRWSFTLRVDKEFWLYLLVADIDSSGGTLSTVTVRCALGI